MAKARVYVLIGALLLVVGALMPWATVSSPILGGISKSVSGIEGDGIITAGIGVLLLIGALVSKGKPGRLYSIASGIFGLIALLLLGYKWLSLATLGIGASAGITYRIDMGIYISLIGAFLAGGGGFSRVPALLTPSVVTQAPPEPPQPAP